MASRALLVSFAILSLLVALCSPASAQLRAENDADALVPRERAQLIFDATCQAVAEEFHAKHENICNFPVKLVLVRENEHYEEDESTNAYTIFLQAWSEDKFMLGIIRFSVLRLTTQHRRARLRAKVLARVGSPSTVSLVQLKGTK